MKNLKTALLAGAVALSAASGILYMTGAGRKPEKDPCQKRIIAYFDDDMNGPYDTMSFTCMADGDIRGLVEIPLAHEISDAWNRRATGVKKVVVYSDTNRNGRYDRRVVEFMRDGEVLGFSEKHLGREVDNKEVLGIEGVRDALKGREVGDLPKL